MEKNFVKNLSKISGAKLVSSIIVVMIVLFYLRPLGLPVPVSETTQSFYDAIEDLPDGSVVGVQCILTDTGFAEQKGGIAAILTHLFDKSITLVFFSVYQPTSPPLVDKSISMVPKDIVEKNVYGEDYVVYGFVGGEEQSLTAIGNNVWDIYPMDQYGTPTEDIPLMENVREASDFDLVVILNAWFPASEASVRQWDQTFNVPIVLAVDAAQFMALQPYYPEQVNGLIFGVRGGAEYEILIQRPGTSIAFTDAMSGMAILLTIALVAGNIVKGKKEEM